MRTLLMLAAATCVLSACVVERPVPREPDFAARGDQGRWGDRDRDYRDERRDEHREGRYDDRDHGVPGNMPPPPPGRY